MSEPFDPEVLLTAPLMAHLATSSPDGPRTTPVWYIWEEGALWMLGGAATSSVLRLQADPRCSVDIVQYDNPGGVLLHLGVRGAATIETDVAARFRRLLANYLGPDEAMWNPWFIENIADVDAPTTRMIRLSPDSFFTNNVSFFRTGPDLAWPEKDV